MAKFVWSSQFWSTLLGGICAAIVWTIITEIVRRRRSKFLAKSAKRGRGPTTTPVDMPAYGLWGLALSALVLLSAIVWLQYKSPALPPWIDPKAITLPIATAADLKQERIEGKTIIVSQLIEDKVQVPGIIGKQWNVVGRVFSKCDIFGPGVLGIQGTVAIRSNVFVHPESTQENSIDSYLFLTQGRYSIGGTTMTDCSFLGCRFFGIGFSGTKDVLDMFRNGMVTDKK